MQSSLPAQPIIKLSSGRVVSRDELLAAMRGSDYVLLGERHDNPRHHALRGALLHDLNWPAAVVAEQLPSGRRVWFSTDLLGSLRATGFEADAWGWPLYEPLFAGVARAGLPVVGGNVDRDIARRVAREGEAALPAELALVLRGAPLSSDARAALDADLIASHCGQVPAARVASMRWAQGARDAALWAALRDSGTHPAVLLAGNGHVRQDYGVPRLIAAWQPGAKVVSVGFLEGDDELAEARVRGAPLYTHAWVTAGPSRSDPCAGLAQPAR